MSLIKWEPFDKLDNLIDDQLLGSFAKPSWDFATDIYEENGNIVAKVSLPEIDVEDIDVSFEDNILTITGKREEEKEVEKKDYYRKEIRRGEFSRSVRLPKAILPNKANAKCKNGIVTITAPVVPEEESKSVKIPIKNSG